MAREERITLGGGCFWCIETTLARLEGVHEAISGYTGGHVENPTYEQVCSGTTGHAEVVRVRYAPDVITTREVLEAFFTVHDPTQKDRQGNDIGTQYRSAIFYENEEQRKVAEELMAEFEREDTFGAPLVTELEPLGTFYEAESYHQDYYRRNPSQGYCMAVIRPKVAKLRQKWSHKLKAE